MTHYSKEDVDVTIGKNIKAARIALGWTQSSLAERTGCISRATVGKIESFNSTSISIYTLSKIASALGIPVYMLLLCKMDWKNLFKIATSRREIERYRQSGQSILPDDVERIEAMSKSALRKERQTAVVETNAVVVRILGIESAGIDKLSKDINQSMTAGTGMATAMVPNIPIVNGLIATMIST